MAYKDKFEREVDLELDEATELAVKIVMKEGELRFRDALIESLENDIRSYLDEVDGMPNTEWVEGVRYVIHILKDADLDG